MFTDCSCRTFCEGSPVLIFLLAVDTFMVRHPIDTHDLHKIPLSKAGQVMLITQFLDSSKFDPETKRVMGVAFEMARAALQLGDQGNLINERVAKRIIELAKTGELNPDLLCEAVLKEFRQHL